MLLPVWISAYRYRDKVYRFLINGQTGEVSGESPKSWWKIAFLVLGHPRRAVRRAAGGRQGLKRKGTVPGTVPLSQPTCPSIVSPSETSNLPGASTLSDFTTPSSTSIEKRWQRMPMPRALRSSSSPSAFA